ncbi:MAG: ABC transporter permease [Eggerthellaceae bacterium]|nr:ABC transporter permease [Eggerthellaceae bacterium]
MQAVFRHELRSYLHSLAAFLFAAFLLEFVGIGAMIYNIQAAVANFEYVLQFVCIGMTVIVPVLTMKTLAEERKQKTDRLLYSLPLTTTQVIVGKYLALLVVFLIPLCVIATYPLIFSLYGSVSLLTAYGALFAFFVMGAALIAVGMFASSLTENQGFAAGIAIPVLLLNYYSVTLAEYVSATAAGSLLALTVLLVLVAALVRFLTKSTLASGAVLLVGIVALIAVSIADSASLEGLLPAVMEQFSLFERFYGFVNGVFDLTSIVFYLTVAVFFLFLSGQALEKRRYN